MTTKQFQLKGIASLKDLKPGSKTEFEVEGLEGAKVLLTNSNGKVNALSPKCTHFGAPLVKGVLHGDRLTCPWHGACFNVTSGDVEDAPALDPLAKFEIEEKDGKVFVTGEEKVLKDNFPNSLSISCKATGAEKVIVVGGGSGSLGAVEGLRAGGYSGQLTVISSEGYQPIDRTKLSKALLADVGKLAWRKKDFYTESSVELVDDEVTKVDFDGKKLETKSGKTYKYTKLVLATGGSPNWLPLPGLKGDLENVFVLRTIPHVKSILEAVGDNGKKIVVVGSSFIGMEVANALVGKKNDVTVIGMEEEPMERVMGKEVGKIFRGLLEKNGVKFYMKASVEKATPSKSDPKKVGAVHLKDGTVLEADLVIEGVGVKPQTSYLKDNSSVSLLKDNSLETDESFVVKGLKDVYAIGDIATYPYHGPGGDGKPVRIEHWNVAQNAGRSVAASINKSSSKPEFFIPVFWSALGQQLRYCGNTVNGYDDVVLLGSTDPAKPSWVAYYTKGETVVAVATMGKDPIMSQSAELMRLGTMPTKSALKDGKDVLSV
jgi:NADPH-dependent 2,4-dienoyl-CoA reductase/sulfur reductase-like enzyme/nitrite reductase/ring-hydroxylating ferredoxin subunit